MASARLDPIEKTILGIIIFLVLAFIYVFTKLVLGIAAFIVICFMLGFVAEKILAHIEE